MIQGEDGRGDEINDERPVAAAEQQGRDGKTEGGELAAGLKQKIAQETRVLE
jgi:hypothetical protein